MLTKVCLLPVCQIAFNIKITFWYKWPPGVYRMWLMVASFCLHLFLSLWKVTNCSDCPLVEKVTCKLTVPWTWLAVLWNKWIVKLWSSEKVLRRFFFWSYSRQDKKNDKVSYICPVGVTLIWLISQMKDSDLIILCRLAQMVGKESLFFSLP